MSRACCDEHPNMSGSPAPSPGGAPRGPPPAFFVESKKGEVNELRTVRVSRSVPLRLCCENPGFRHAMWCWAVAWPLSLLFPRASLQLIRTVTAEKDNKRKRDVIKKVIAYMTLGIDVSRLFSDMVLVRAVPISRKVHAMSTPCSLAVPRFTQCMRLCACRQATRRTLW